MQSFTLITVLKKTANNWKVLIREKILSRKTIPSKHTHNTNNLYTEQGLKAEEDSRYRGETMAGLLFQKQKCLEIRLGRVQRWFPSKRKGKIILSKMEKTWEPTAEILIQGIYRLWVSKAERMGWCVKLKTVTETSSIFCTFIVPWYIYII